jgi:hypothetical protein
VNLVGDDLLAELSRKVHEMVGGDTAAYRNGHGAAEAWRPGC